MRAAVTAFTRTGAALGRRIAQELGASLSLPPRLAEELGEPAYESLAAWTQSVWDSAQALIFVGACGIAVRAIAPHVRDKFTDPAVVAVDEAGRFAIPLLSGHMGGGNDLARRLAALTGGQAVISTATDVNGLWAVDEWARDCGFVLTDREMARAVSAALLEGKPVGFSADFPLAEPLPPGLYLGSGGDVDILVTSRQLPPRKGLLRLVPKRLTLGIGCRKGATEEAVARTAAAALSAAGLDPVGVMAVATIDLKAREPGLLAFCARRKLPLLTFSAQQLAALPGSFTPSPFVRSVTGVDNVCERAAVAGGGTLLAEKLALDGVTAAIAAFDVTIHFSAPRRRRPEEEV